MYEMILFDLDGTLLPMDNDVFTKGYFKVLAAKLAPLGYEPKQLIDAIWSGTAAMMKNDGSRTNEDAFWARFVEIFGDAALKDKPVFEEFYRVDFQVGKNFCGFNAQAAETVAALKAKGYRIALATNPIFPIYATESRIEWAGLNKSDFELVTSYETSYHAKPNPAYFADVAAALGVAPEKCLMVGNDAYEDGAARKAGMDVFLLTDCLINSKGLDISGVPQGSFADLRAYLGV